jgi:mycothiol synthase
LAADVAAELANLGPSGAPKQIWLEETQDSDTAILEHLATPYRDLLQLRRPLPAPASGLDTRAFDPSTDAEAFFAVNNRAFAWHPEQSGFDQARLDKAMAEPWFNPQGFRILELDGVMAGFCWTKLHQELTPVVGEIYVIAIDPDFHGRGLGGPMTLAGLEWISDQGITVANLYVEADNAPALATYDRLGFTTHSIDRAFTTAK